MALVPRQGTRDRARARPGAGARLAMSRPTQFQPAACAGACYKVAPNERARIRRAPDLHPAHTPPASGAHLTCIRRASDERVSPLLQTFSPIRLSHPVTAARHAPNARDDARRGTDTSDG